MHKIIRQIVKERGNAVITSAVLVNCMDDVAAFESVDNKIFKKILRAVIRDGYSQKLLNIGQWNQSAKLLITEYAKKNALSEDYVSYLFKCLAYGLGWTRTNPVPPAIDPVVMAAENHQQKSPLDIALEKAAKAERKARESEHRLLVAQQKLSIAEAAAKAAKAREQRAKRETKAKTAKEQKTNKEKAEKKKETVAYAFIGLAWVVWLAGAIYGVFYLSDGWWNAAITITLEGGIAYLLAFGSMFIDYFVEDSDTNVFVRALGVGFILAAEVALHHLVYQIILWL